MSRNRRTYSVILGLFLLLALILDTHTAAEGVRLGIEQCLQVIIPALLPFFIITTYLNSILLGMKIPFLHSLGKLLNVPSGSSSLLLLGLIGGYPVGAQLIAETYQCGKLSKRSAQILLGYCNNAGPAFIFGVLGSVFPSKRILIFLWGIHLSSAIITGFLLPKSSQASLELEYQQPCSIVTSLRKSISICASVCGWVIVCKILIAYAEQWVLKSTNPFIMIIFQAILELSNGCLALSSLQSETTRFILCAAFLACGGFCVLLQTMSVTAFLGLGLYIPGKIMQTSVSLILATAIAYYLFPSRPISATITIPLVICTAIIISISRIWIKKRYGNSV